MIIKTIYNLEPEIEVDKISGVCHVELKYENMIFPGYANLSPLDKEFFSEKVGLNIALSRARMSLLRYALNKAIAIYNAKNQMYKEVIGSAEAADPTGKFLKNVLKAEKNVKKLRAALKSEKSGLNFYIRSQDKFIKRIKKQREKDNSN